MVVREVFEVLYSPVKAFRKIVEKPDFKGVLLILVLSMSFMAVSQYVFYSKIFLLTETPDNDDWTESLSNQRNWTSNDSPSLDETDYKRGNTVGNHSVKSLIFNDTSIWMKIKDIGSFDCSEDKGYEELFFWIKWIHPNGTFPSSGALRLFSDSESSYFKLDLTSFISTSSDEWSNATLKIGPDQGWNSTNSPEWQSVTGLELRLVWLAPANLTMKIDDLHFQKYVSVVRTYGAIGILISAAVAVPMNWMLWALILLMITKVFREGGVPGTVFFVVIGYVFIVTVVYALASAVLFSSLPACAYALIHERWYPYLAYQVLLYLPFIHDVWTAVLCAIAIRPLFRITWGKAISISVVAFVIRFIIEIFFGL